MMLPSFHLRIVFLIGYRVTVDSAKRPHIFILAGIAAAGPLAVNLFVPALPVIADEFSVGRDVVQWALTLYFVGVSIGQLLYGPLSDIFGRRIVVLGGILLYCLSSFSCLFSESIYFLIFSRFTQAFGGCVGMVMSRAIIQDVFPNEKFAAALSTVVMVSATAPMVAPTIGGYISEWFGWRYVFLLLGLASLGLMVSCVIGLRETHFRRLKPSLGSLLSSYGEVLRSGKFLPVSIATALIPSSYFAFMAGAPYIVVNTMHRTSGEYGAMAMVAPAGFVLGNAVARKVSTRLGPTKTLLLGGGGTAIGLCILLGLVVLLPLSAFNLFAPMLLVSFGHGLGIASGISIAMSEARHLSGTASALGGFLQMCAAAVASNLAGTVVGISPAALVGLMTLIHGLGVLVFVLGRPRCSAVQ